MPTNIVLDLNVVLDVLLERTDYEDSLSVLEQGESSSYTLCLSAHAVTTFAYLLEHAKVPPPQLKLQLDWLLQTFTIVSIDAALLRAAAQSKVADYEDAVVEQAALACKAEVIVTRNGKDFKSSVVTALSPKQFLASR